MMRKSGEQVEGTRDVDKQPQTMGVHESSRRQVLRFSASSIHRCHSLVGSVNRPKRFQIDASPYHQGSPRAADNPGTSADTSFVGSRPDRRTKQHGNGTAACDRITRHVAKFYISCSRVAVARCSHRSAKRLSSSAICKDANVADLLR